MIAELGRVIKRLHYPVEAMLLCVRWYAALVHEYLRPGSIVFSEVTKPLRPTCPTSSTPNVGITSRRCRSS